VKVGLAIPNSGPDAVRGVRLLPKVAEDAGFASVFFIDHVISTAEYDHDFGTAWVEPLTALTYASAATRRIGLGVSVLVAPYRDPVYAAKILSNIDQFSSGRVILGLGTGYSPIEYAALGRRRLFDERGAVTDEAIDVMKTCWRGGEVNFDGAYFQFADVRFEPPPVQAGGPRLWIGGQSPRALRRAARVGDGWHPAGLSADDVKQLGARLLDLTDRKVEWCPRIFIRDLDAARIGDQIRAYEEIGCTNLVVSWHELSTDGQRRFIDAVSTSIDLDEMSHA
jgi:probable F420-dependent oxidoreductase